MEVLSIVAVLTRSVILEARTGKAEVTALGFLLPSRCTSLTSHLACKTDVALEIGLEMEEAV